MAQRAVRVPTGPPGRTCAGARTARSASARAGSSDQRVSLVGGAWQCDTMHTSNWTESHVSFGHIHFHILNGTRGR